MDGNRQVNKILSFILALLIVFMAAITPAQALLKGGTWQELRATTGAVNGTAPHADGAIIPVRQGSTLLDPRETYDIDFSVMPRDFSADATSTAMRAVNSTDIEGDLFTSPPTIAWDNQQPPTMGLVWADAKTPDTPLSPQPILNQSFCAQNLAGRQLVVWPQVEDETTLPALWLYTRTGVPNIAAIPLLSPKITLNIKPAVSDPITVSADRVDDAFAASKARAGENITLSIATKACDGEIAPNAAFVIRREDAQNRQGGVNNVGPVHVGDTELTTTQTEFHGVTDAQGNATVVVTQAQGPGVKTHLIVSAQNYPTLTASVDVIFTTLTSPDTGQATMYGHMPNSTTAELDGITYTFTRPKLAVETSGSSKSIVDSNETWAQFTWRGADNHCDILPAAEQVVALRHAHGTSETYTGWPVLSSNEYWSSTKSQVGSHFSVNMNSASPVSEPDGSSFLVSCVDKALPAVHPQIVLSPGLYKTEVGETIDMSMTVVDKDTQQPLPYRYVELFLDSALNRQGLHNDAWDSQRVVIESNNFSASSSSYYTGVTDANGQAHLTLKHDNGMGVETPIRAVVEDDDGAKVELPFSAIFTVVTSPDVSSANMWGHMRGVVDAGNLYKRPQLASEASAPHGEQSENNEMWATFSSVADATSQCGTGQVPATSSLTHLYSENPANQMATDHGWPTGLQAYISADISGGSPANVDLKDGGTGSGAPNYLTCSANEKVAVLDVYFNDDPSLRNGEAKVGEQIKMTVVSMNALNNQPIPNVDFTVTLSPGRQRDGLTTGFTDPSDGQLMFDGVAYSAAHTAVYQGMTDTNGKAEIILTQPQGVGIMTPLSVVPVDSLINRATSRSVKFTVATSPNSPKANMWGHMADTIAVGDLTFERPKLAEEVTAERTQVEANETWARVLHSAAARDPDAGGCAVNRLPRIDQLEALYNENSGGAIARTQGWPTLINYWSSTYQSASTWKTIVLSNGREIPGSNASIYVSCLTTDNPIAASITFEPVDASQWYEGSGVRAVKAKKGDTISLKVTVKDASSQPLPGAPFVLTRGDGYDRKGNKYTAQEGSDAQGIVTPVVIDGESLAWTTTKMGLQTGVDGSRIISVTRPDTLGTRTAINATLYENAAVSASVDTIFTVITSPDVNVAHMWGHMQPSLTAADGEVYERPLLYSELSSTSNTVQYTEDNESWAGFYGPASGKNNVASCGAGYFPSVVALDSLYSQYPGRTIKTAEGWPINRSYWSGTSAGSLSTSKPDAYYTVDLDDDAHRSASNSASSDMQYQICSAKPMTPAALITLTSALATDGGAQAVKVKNSESIPLIVTTTGSAGNPAPYTRFALTRDAGVARDTSYKFSGRTDMTLTSPGGSPQQLYATGSTLYGTTGADGTLSLELNEESGPGVKNVLTASVYDTPSVTSPLAVIFTVITSPDSSKANMWGHMPETVTNNAGVTFHRPLLYSEMSGGTSSNYKASNETWPLVSKTNAQKTGVTGCDEAYQPLLNDLQTLYNDYPGGAIETLYGWPVTQGKYWWALDRVVKSGYYQLMRLDNNAKTDTGYAGTTGAQVCLVDPHAPLPATIELTSSLPATANNEVKVKKGEAIPLTVMLKDDSGRPVANAAFTLTRGDGINRGGQVKTTGKGGATDDFTLQELTPTSATITLDRYSSFSGMTGGDGKATFSLRQDAAIGLKTALMAQMADYPNQSSTLNVIFTVVTSPDTDKAQYWGHMPETVTSSDGVIFKRPLLATEVSNEDNTFGSSNFGDELWPLFSHSGAGLASKSTCADDYQPTLSELQTLYDDYPGGKIGELFGWPIDRSTFSWWVADTSGAYYEVIDLTSGKVNTSKTSTDAQALVCLAQPHGAHRLK